ncbi:MAG: glycosyltransferase family 2 protein [Candidatus Geothermincolia bacterium]
MKAEGARRVSTIVVLYNSAEYIEACIGSVASSSYPDSELVMVDNGSRDRSALLARRVAERLGIGCTISVLQKNSGFARANNLGFGLATGDIILLLNPDAELYEDTIDELVRAFDDPAVGVAGCKVYYPDGETLQHAGGYVRDNGLTMHYGVGEKDEGAYDEPRDVPYVTGAALAVRRDVFESLGMLDSGFYPAYFEELDLCLHVRRLGFKVLYAPRARIVHHESTTTGRFTKKYYYLYHKNRIRFLLKNFSWRFLLERSWLMERTWLGMIDLEEQGTPLKRAYLVNLIALPRTMAARMRTERMIRRPRLEDTTREL